jgi:hypothetical protein
VRGVDQAVGHGVGNCRIADILVPMRDRKLASDHGGGAPVAVVDDLQQVAPLIGGEWCDGAMPRSSRISTCTRARLSGMRA